MDYDYKEYIESLATSSESVEFYNSGPEHAAIVLGTIFKTASQYVKVYCANMLSEAVSNSEIYLNAVDEFLKRVTAVNNQNLPLQIIFSNPIGDAFRRTPIYKILYKHRAKVQIKSLNTSAGTRGIRYKGIPAHFTCADDRMYRLETDIVNKKAFGNFNDPQGAMVIRNAFDGWMNDTDRTVDFVW